MNFKIMSGFAEEANIGITAIAVVLNEVFKKYEQPVSLEEVEKISPGQLILPIMAYEHRRIHLKTKAIKNTFCEARFIAYSKQPDAKQACSRFIFAEKCVTREAAIDAMAVPIRDAHFDKEGEETIVDLISRLGGIKSDKVSYFYCPVTCEGVITHAIAVVHEFGPEGDPFCVATAYFSISVGK